ncbi:MAG TPA: rhodanese-like domain-containing protein, partial [Steroidobacteraceae bacterium]|nr:rhodanese-like domain-containing protein [Steroidobacteraceae bacterium]
EPLRGRLLTYDALALSFSEFRVRRRRDCAVCGDAPTITQPMDAKPMRDDSSPGIRQLSAAALAELLQAGGSAAPLLVDVREPAEFAAGHLPGSLHIPLGELPQRLGEIPPGAAPVFMCRGGGRSMAACQLALRARIASPANLEGGLLAWSREVDPALTVL